MTATWDEGRDKANNPYDRHSPTSLRQFQAIGQGSNAILHFILDWIISRLDFRVGERTRENDDEDQDDEDQYG